MRCSWKAEPHIAACWPFPLPKLDNRLKALPHFMTPVQSGGRSQGALCGSYSKGNRVHASSGCCAEGRTPGGCMRPARTSAEGRDPADGSPGPGAPWHSESQSRCAPWLRAWPILCPPAWHPPSQTDCTHPQISGSVTSGLHSAVSHKHWSVSCPEAARVWTREGCSDRHFVLRILGV